MHFNTASVAATILAIQPAMADFIVFSGYSNSAPDDQRTNINIFVNDAPDCGTALNSPQITQNFYNDASHGEIACDGCDAGTAPQDWDVTRFEIHDDNGSALVGPDEDVHISKLYCLGYGTMVNYWTALFKDADNGGWGLYDTNMNLVGNCDRPDPIQNLDCPDVFAADSTAGIFHCMSALPLTLYTSLILM